MWRLSLAAVAAIGLLTAANASENIRIIDSTGDPRLDGILSRVTWGEKELRFSFPESPIFESPQIYTEFKPLPFKQRELVRSVFREIESLTMLRFTEVSSAKDAQLTFAQWNRESRLGRVNASIESAPFPSAGGQWVGIRGQTWLSPDDANLVDDSLGGYPRHWWRHEIGHIVGLEHTHNNFARSPLPLDLDTYSNTIMTYRLTKSHILNFPRGNVFTTSFMPIDIFALQHLYGLNWKHNQGNTVYKFVPDSGDFFVHDLKVNGNPSGKLFMTIWDGGGYDTLDFSAYSTNGQFDLRPGHFCTPWLAQRVEFKAGEFSEGSVALPYLPKGDKRAFIEKIIVGNGDNVIIANGANNEITLGSGINTLEFHPGNHKDKISGFGSNDIIDISGYRVPIDMVQVKIESNDTVLSIDQWPGDEVRLVGYVGGLNHIQISPMK